MGLWIFRPVSGDEPTTRGEPVALPRARRQRAVGDPGSFRSPASRRAKSVDHQSFGLQMPTCRFAGRHATMVDRLVLFAPIACRPPRRYERPTPAPAWRFVTLE